VGTRVSFGCSLRGIVVQSERRPRWRRRRRLVVVFLRVGLGRVERLRFFEWRVVVGQWVIEQWVVERKLVEQRIVG